MCAVTAYNPSRGYLIKPTCTELYCRRKGFAKNGDGGFQAIDPRHSEDNPTQTAWQTLQQATCGVVVFTMLQPRQLK